MDFSPYQKSTKSVWAGETDAFTDGAVTTPIVKSVAFAYTDLDEWHEVALGNADGFIYSRNTNPTVHVLEEKIRILEGGEAATSFATGMGAISNTLFALLSPGKRVVSINDTYGGASRLFLDFLPRYQVNVTLCTTTDFDEIEAEVAKGCDVLYLETPTNPTLKVVDIARLAAAAKKVGAVTVVDNTFATPINQIPGWPLRCYGRSALRQPGTGQKGI
jgi:cystathionine gamma-synthase